LEHYGFGKSRDFLVRDPRSGELCDSKAIAAAAYGHQFAEKEALRPAEFSGGEATVVSKLRSLGFEVVRIGEDWSAEEVAATIASYFEMLRLDARGERYRKSDFNASLRQQLRGGAKRPSSLSSKTLVPCFMGWTCLSFQDTSHAVMHNCFFGKLCTSLCWIIPA
jgi:hypothetical protein